MGFARPLVKLIVFGLVTVLATYLLISTITNQSFGDQTTYRAQFTDVTGLAEGDDVRIAGVRVGSVEGIAVVDRNVAEVTFTVQSSTPLPDSVQALVRYRNLVGQRYIALSEGNGSGGKTLAADDVIPLERTTPALDLTALFGGFRPLFQALAPDDVNRLSFEIIQVFQGEGDTVNSLLGHVASLTGSLADKDAVIGSVIQNLNLVLGTVADRDVELDGLIVSLQQFVTGLSSDRQAIFDSLTTINDLALTTAGFVEEARPPLAADIEALGALAGGLSDNGATLEDALSFLPFKLETITRTATYASWFNFYLCSAGGTVTLPGGQAVTLDTLPPPGELNPETTAARCTEYEPPAVP